MINKEQVHGGLICYDDLQDNTENELQYNGLDNLIDNLEC